MRTIDADVLKQSDFQDFSNTDVFNAINNAPTVNAVVLPVNVGDVVYVNFSIDGDYLRKDKRPYACKVGYIGLNEKGGYFNIQFENRRMWSCDFNEIGVVVFLTKEQAENTLKGGAEQ